MHRTRLSIAISFSMAAAALALTVVSPASPDVGGSLRTAVRANTVVRIDPRTNAISSVISVGSGPMATTVGGRSVWVYNDAERTVSEIDAATNRVRRTTPVSARPVDLGYLAGPVLAADPRGAWLVGIDEQLGPLLTRVPAGAGDSWAYMLDVEPRAVAVGAGAVWVLGHRPGDNELVRLNPTSGKVTGRTWFPDAGRVDSIDVGLGAVYVMSAATATLYRVDARTMELDAHADLGSRAGRPRVRFGMVWVGVSDAAGATFLLDRRTLDVALKLGCCRLGSGYDSVDGFGSNWTTDRSTGTTVRWDGHTYERVATVHVTAPPRSGGLCETAVAAGAGAVWVAVAPALEQRCGSG